MRYFLLIFAVAVAATMLIAGKQGSLSRKPPIEIWPDMDRQLKLRPQTDASFFADNLSSRQPLEGTVSRGSHYQGIPANTGRISGTTNFVEVLPVPVTAQLLARGQERYGISCLPCHGAVGDGKGITSKYGMVGMANFHDKRLILMADGEYFHVITNGKGLMGAYGSNVVPEDRWAIIAYVRALQRSRLASIDDVPAELRSSLK